MPMDSFRKGKDVSQVPAQRTTILSGGAARVGKIAPQSPPHNSCPRPPRPVSCDDFMLNSTEDIRPLAKQSTNLSKVDFEKVERPSSSISFHHSSKDLKKELEDTKRLRPKSSHDALRSRSLSFNGIPDIGGSSQRLERIRSLRTKQSRNVVFPEDDSIPIKSRLDTASICKSECAGQDTKDRAFTESTASLRRRYFVDMQNTAGSPRERGCTNTMCHFDVYLPSSPADSNTNDLRRLYYCDFLIPAPPTAPPVPVTIAFMRRRLISFNRFALSRTTYLPSRRGGLRCTAHAASSATRTLLIVTSAGGREDHRRRVPFEVARPFTRTSR
jgi:hypothetical protein